MKLVWLPDYDGSITHLYEVVVHNRSNSDYSQKYWPLCGGMTVSLDSDGRCLLCKMHKEYNNGE